MKPVKVYEYSSCSTCRKARQFLAEHDIPHQLIAIADKPPGIDELKTMATKHLGGELKKLFNTSGQEYRRLELKDKLRTMSESEIYQLLASNGMLIKRPFALHEKSGAVGFQLEKWQTLFLQL